MFSTVVLSVYIPTNSGRLFLFLHTLSEFFVDIFDDGLSDQREVALTCVSLLISPFWLSLRPLIFFFTGLFVHFIYFGDLSHQLLLMGYTAVCTYQSQTCNLRYHLTTVKMAIIKKST